MAHYLVTASPRDARLPELRERLSRDEFTSLRPFGKALSYSLRRARQLPNGQAIWEEEDYRPTLGGVGGARQRLGTHRGAAGHVSRAGRTLIGAGRHP